MQTVIKNELLKDYKGRNYALEIRTAGRGYEVILAVEDAEPYLFKDLHSRKYQTLDGAKKAFRNVKNQF